MQEWFSSLTQAGGWVLKASGQASVLILVVMAVQGALRSRLSPRWRFALWYLVLARLLLPAFPESAVSIFNLAPTRSIQSMRTIQNQPTAPDPTPLTRTHTMPEPLAFPETTVEPLNESRSPAPLLPSEPASVTQARVSILQMLAAIWLAGMCALAACILLGLRGMSHRLRCSQPVEDKVILQLLEQCKARVQVRQKVRVFSSDQFQSPCLVGFLTPRLQLPGKLLQSFTEQELRLIFLHELAHVKRRDILINWLCTVAQLLHWFNPLVWFAFSRMHAHREVACDALALTAAGEQEREVYGDTIIRLLEGFTPGSTVAGSVGILEDRHQIKERIRMIARFKIASRWSLLAAPLLLVIGVLCLTDAQVSVPLATPQQTGANPLNPKMVVKVLNENGKPLANVPVQANFFTEDDWEGHDVVTDAQGFARIPQPNHPEQPIRGMNLWVVSPNHPPRVVRWNQYNIPVEYTFKLTPGKALSGLVINEKGQPVANTQVRIQGPGVQGDHDEEIQFHGRLNKMITDANGRWSCNFIPPDFKELRMILTHTNYAVTEKTLSLPAAFSEENRITLARANTIMGRVFTDTGEPVAGARIREVHNFGWRKAETKTDSEGNFILQGLRTGSTLIVVQADGRAPDGNTVDISGDVNGMEFRLKKGNRFSGRVIDQAGQPVLNVEVGIGSDNQGLKKVEFETHTDAQGRFEWNSGPDEALLFYVRGKGVRFVHDLNLGPGEHEIKVVREESDHILITGKVVDAKTGQPISEFHITIGEEWNGDMVNWTSLGTDGHAGEFKLPIGKPARYPRFVLQATAPGYFPTLSSNLTMEGGDQTIELRMPKGAPLAGTVVFSDGKPVSGTPVFLCGAHSAPYMDKPGQVQNDMEGYSTTTGTNGAFRLNPIAQQHSVVIVHPDGYLEIPVAAFEETNRFVLRPYGRVEGILFVNGKPSAGETITVSSMHYRYGLPGTPKRDFPLINIYLSATTDPSGKFVFDKVPPGDRQIWQALARETSTRGPIATHHQTFVAVRAGETSRVDLGLGGKKVVGRVTLKGSPENFDWKRDLQRLEPKPPIPNRPLQKDFADMKAWGAAAQKFGQADRAFWQSPEGYEFARSHRSYCAVFDDKGNFTINDVLPGPYTFTVRLTEEQTSGPLGPSKLPFHGRPIAEGLVDVIVPGGEGSATVDAGEMVLEAKQPPNGRASAQ